VSRLLLYVTTVLATLVLAVAADSGDTRCASCGSYIFSWPFIDTGSMQPRGGTTKGPPVTLMSGPSRVWEHLREAGLEKKERDRRAILAMAGPYRTSFNFLETVGFTPDFTPDQPYASWATEYVYVLADEPDFISLQHVIVMFFQDDGGVSGPMVVKHWRQDWRYQDRDLRVYRGDNRWQQQRLDPETVRGKWSQAVFQVDDSPRYESLGAWRHSDSYSVWESADTWRPLPRSRARSASPCRRSTSTAARMRR